MDITPQGETGVNGVPPQNAEVPAPQEVIPPMPPAETTSEILPEMPDAVVPEPGVVASVPAAQGVPEATPAGVNAPAAVEGTTPPLDGVPGVASPAETVTPSPDSTVPLPGGDLVADSTTASDAPQPAPAEITPEETAPGINPGDHDTAQGLEEAIGHNAVAATPASEPAVAEPEPTAPQTPAPTEPQPFGDRISPSDLEEIRAQMRSKDERVKRTNEVVAGALEALDSVAEKLRGALGQGQDSPENPESMGGKNA